MLRLAPLLYVFSKLLEIGGHLGPFPTRIPGLGNVLTEVRELKKMTKAFERVAALSDCLGDAKQIVDALQKSVQAPEGPLFKIDSFFCFSLVISSV